jgi:hypothetical protein
VSIRSMFRSAALAALVGLALAPATGAQAQVAAGALSCRGGGSVGLVVTSYHQLDCIFRPGSGAPPQRYEARIRKIGVDLGFTQGEAMEWIVFAPTGVVGPGALMGAYGGAQASASLGVGIGANALVGGFHNSFALQPVSVTAQAGLNVAGGVAGLELVWVQEPTRPQRRHHHRHHRH